MKYILISLIWGAVCVSSEILILKKIAFVLQILFIVLGLISLAKGE